MTAVGVTEKASDGNDAGRRRQGCGARFVTTFNESMERQQQKQRRRNKADPWIVRKFAGAYIIVVGCDDSSDALLDSGTMHRSRGVLLLRLCRESLCSNDPPRSRQSRLEISGQCVCPLTSIADADNYSDQSSFWWFSTYCGC